MITEAIVSVAIATGVLIHVLIYKPIIEYADRKGIVNKYTTSKKTAGTAVFIINCILFPALLLIFAVPAKREAYVRALTTFLLKDD